MDDIDKLLTARRPFLTDGGFETWLFFQQGFEAPEFAAIVLLDDPAAQAAMGSRAVASYPLNASSSPSSAGWVASMMTNR